MAAVASAREELRRLRSGVREWLKNRTPEVRGDREVVLIAVKRDGLALEHASAALRADRDVVLAAVQKGAFALRFAAPALLADRDFVLEAVKRNGYALACAPEALTADRDIVMAAVREDGSALEYAAETMKADKEVAMVAVRNSSPALEHIADDLWSDPTFVKAAAADNPEALEYVADELRSDRSFVMALLKRNPSVLKHAPAAMLADKDFLLAAVKVSAYALDHFPAKVRADRSFLLAAAERQPEVLERMRGHELWQDPEFVLAAVEHLDSAFSFAAESLRSNKDLLLRAVRVRPIALRYAAGGLQDDREFLLEAVSLRGEALSFASAGLRREKDFVLEALRKNPASIEYVPTELWSEAIFVLEALKIASSALAHAAPKLRSDRGFVLRAVAIHGGALSDAAPELRADRSVLETAIHHAGSSEVSAVLSGAAPTLQSDRRMVLMALHRSGAALEHASEALQADAEVALVAVANDHDAFRFASPALRADPAFVLRTVGSGSSAQPGAALAHAAEGLRSNANYVLQCIELQPASIQYASSRLLRDRNFLLTSVCWNPESLSFLPSEFRTSRSFITAAVQANRTAVRFIPTALQADRVVAESVGIEPMGGFGLVTPPSPSPSSANGDGEDFEFCELFAEDGDASLEAGSRVKENSIPNSNSPSAGGGGMFDFDELDDVEESRRGAGVSLESMAELLGHLESMESVELKDAYKKFGLPPEPGMESQGLRNRLSSFCRWASLPASALADEWAACRRCSGGSRDFRQQQQDEEKQEQAGGATGSRDEALSEEDQRKLLVRRLVTHACAEAWRSLGIFAERFASMQEAACTVRRCARLSSKSKLHLAAKGRASGLFVGRASERSDLERELKAIQIWRGLPVYELRKECEARGLSTCHIQGSDFMCRKQLICRLLEALLLAALEKRRGVPVRRLASTEAAWRVACEWERLEGLSTDGLQEECAVLGLPAVACVTWYERADLIQRLQRAALLRELPPGEVEADLVSQGLRSSSPADAAAAAAAAGANNGTASSSGRGQADARRSALDFALIDVFSSVFFERRGVPVRELGSIRAASAVLTCWEYLASLTAQELVEEFHAKLGIAPLLATAATPSQSGAGAPPRERGKAGEEWRAELENRLRSVGLWQELPLSGLRSACKRFGLLAKWVNSGGGHNGAAATEGPEELRERLLRTVCMEEYAARGVDLRRLGSIDVARRLLEAWERLDVIEKDQLDLEYKALGVGGTGSGAGGGSQPSAGRWKNGVFHAGAPERAPATPLDTRRRLKAVAFWRALPFEELQKECWDLGCRSLYMASFREIEEGKATFIGELIAEGALQRLPPAWPSGVSRPAAAPAAGHGAPSAWASASSAAAGKQQADDPPQSPPRSRSPSPAPRPVFTRRPKVVVQQLEALELPPDADLDDVKKSFRKLALKYHPDKQERVASTQKTATEQFRGVAEAYNALLDYFKGAA